MDAEHLKSTNLRKLKILSFSISSEKIKQINDYSTIKDLEDFSYTSISDLIYVPFKENKFLISTNETNRIYVFSLNNKKLIHKITVKSSIIENKFSIISIKEIDYDENKNISLFKFAIGTSNGLLYFYCLDLNFLVELNNNITDPYRYLNLSYSLDASLNKNSPSELNGIFSVFLNQYLNLNEIKEKIKSQIELLDFDYDNKIEIIIDEFLNKNSSKDTEPIYYITTKKNNLYAGLNSFVFKYNLNLNLLTQVLPITAATNKISIDNDLIYISTNSGFLLLFESRGILISKIDTSLSSVFKMEKFLLENKHVKSNKLNTNNF